MIINQIHRFTIKLYNILLLTDLQWQPCIATTLDHVTQLSQQLHRITIEVK